MSTPALGNYGKPLTIYGSPENKDNLKVYNNGNNCTYEAIKMIPVGLILHNINLTCPHSPLEPKVNPYHIWQSRN